MPITNCYFSSYMPYFMTLTLKADLVRFLLSPSIIQIRIVVNLFWISVELLSVYPDKLPCLIIPSQVLPKLEMHLFVNQCLNCRAANQIHKLNCQFEYTNPHSTHTSEHRTQLFCPLIYSQFHFPCDNIIHSG